MEITQNETVSPRKEKKSLRKEITLLGIAAVTTVFDIATDNIVGPDKSAPLGIAGGISHIIATIAIVSFFFINNGWNRASQLQKALISVACAGYFISGFEELYRHLSGDAAFLTLGITSGFVALLALLAAVLVNQTKKTK